MSTDLPRCIFMTSVGTGAYNETTYTSLKQNEPELTGKFFPLIRLEQLISSGIEIHEILLLLTPEAKKAHWAENSELRYGFERLGYQVNPIDITAPKTEAELYLLLEKIVSNFNEGDHVYLDITNAFRALGYIYTTAAELGEMTKGISVKQVSYGAFETVDIKDKVTPRPIWDLKHIFDISEWTSAYRRFERSGDPIPLTEMIESITEAQKDHLDHGTALGNFGSNMRALADALMVLNVPELDQCLVTLDEGLEELNRLLWQPTSDHHAMCVLRLMLPKLKKTISELSTAINRAGSDVQKEQITQRFPPIELCRWLLERNRLLSATGLLRESLMGIFFDPISQYHNVGFSLPPHVEAVEPLISAISYATQSGELSLNLDRLQREDQKAFAQWWNELGDERKKETSKLFNEVTQFRNTLLHGWTKKNDLQQTSSFKRKNKGMLSEVKGKLDRLIQRVEVIRVEKASST